MRSILGLLIGILFCFSGCGWNKPAVSAETTRDGLVYRYEIKCGKARINISSTNSGLEDFYRTAAVAWASQPGSQPVSCSLSSLSDHRADFFMFGKEAFFSHWQNLFLFYGLAEIAWEEKMASGAQVFFYSSLPELKNFLTLNPQFSDVLSDYMVSYSLNKVLFVSVQELQERPDRYFRYRETSNPFYALVIAPEALSFYHWLNKKYGQGITTRLALKNYSPDNWKPLTGEAVNDIEQNFTDHLEKMVFEAVEQKPDLKKQMNEILKYYHKTTKTTLFKKS